MQSNDKTNGPLVQNQIQKRQREHGCRCFVYGGSYASYTAVLVVQPQWVQEVLNSYTTDHHAQQLITQLSVSSLDANGYNLHQGLIKHKDLIWIGNKSTLQTKLIAAGHSSAIGGHSGVNATYHMLKRHFVWKGMKTNVDCYIK